MGSGGDGRHGHGEALPPGGPRSPEGRQQIVRALRSRDRCLLHRGRFLAPDGTEIGDAPDDGEPRAPRLFA